MPDFQNQYLLTSQKITPQESFTTYSFEDYYIYAHNSLTVAIREFGPIRIALIGIVINPLMPEHTEEDIVLDILSKVENFLGFCESLSALTGRFVGIYSDGQGLKVVGDACSLRRAYYGKLANSFVLTSSPKLFLDSFGLSLKIAKEKENLIHSKAFQTKDNTWFGNESMDDRLWKLLPNHYLIAQSLQVKRLPAFTFGWAEKDVLSNTASFLENTYVSLHKKFNLMQPITAGWDSRLLLAATKKWKDSVQYYVFGEDKEHQDVRIPLKLNKKFDLNLEVINTNIAFDPDFLASYKAHHILPRISYKTKNIQYHYFNTRHTHTINITGNVGEVLNSYYGVSKIQSTYIIKSFTGYKGVGYVDKQINNWLPEAKKYANQNNISLLDLFYWEQRMGNWGGVFPAEQDIAIDEVAPLNNRTLLWTLLEFIYTHRKDPDFHLFTELIKRMWPELLTIEVNPDNSKIHKITGTNIYLRLLHSKVKGAINSIRNSSFAY